MSNKSDNLISDSICFRLSFVAYYAILLLVLSLVLNVMILGAFGRLSKIRNSIDLSIIAITVMNLIASVFELPFIIISNFACRLDF